jgi:cytochrome P450
VSSLFTSGKTMDADVCNCSLAMLEMKIILSKLLYVYDLELMSKELDLEAESRAYITWMRPAMKIRFIRREGVLTS